MHDRLQAHPIPSTVQEVANSLRRARDDHPTERWRAAVTKVASQVGVAISLRSGGEEPHGNTGIGEALRTYSIVITAPEGWEVRFHLSNCPEGRQQPDQAATSAKGTDAVASGKAKPSAPSPDADRPPGTPVDPTRSTPPIYNEAYLVREFDRRERDRGPIFAGFIVNELIPGMGFDVLEAKQILRAMEAKDMVRSERKPNPKDPERQTTFITLNRAHPHVQRVLQGAAAINRVFPVATIRGEPLSETIIRERR